MAAVPDIADPFDPTDAEIRAWAHSGAEEPVQDWDLMMAEPDHLPVLLELVADPGCPRRARETALGALYCTVGHSRPRDQFLDAARTAERSTDAWVATWARRVLEIIEHPEAFSRPDWCGWPGYAARPTG